MATKQGVLIRAAGWTAAAIALVVVLAFVADRVAPPTAKQPPAPPHQAEFSPTQRAFALEPAAGLTPETYVAARFWQRIHLRVDGVAATATMYARGAALYRDHAVWRPPPFTDTATRERADLAWEWADDSWAIVTITGAGARIELARRVAKAVRQQAAVAINLPPYELPKGYGLVSTTVPYDDNAAKQAELGLATTDPSHPGSPAVDVLRVKPSKT